MAKSPEKNAANSEVIRYDLGWDAINSMLRAGRSLSGHERNCCYLNSGTRRFADVSSIAGLDLDDDGRVLALADWDYDGDIDFWIANRSGPQLRYLENRLNANSFLSLRLEGVHCNRDAIGAKVEIVFELDGRTKKQYATLKAGEGYLAQNSKWVHFGLGDGGKLLEAVVTWPHGKKQTLRGMQAGRFYRVREGDDPVRWEAPTEGFEKLAATEFTAPPMSDAARIVLLNPIPLPPIALEEGVVSQTSKRPRLVNLWATWCQPCIQELGEWKQHATALSESGVEVIAVNVDEPSAGRAATVQQMLAKLDLPFQVANGDQRLVEQFDVLQRSLLSRQRPLPVPSSFLIDSEGRLCVVYKGPVGAETIIADAKLVGAPRDQILAAATPFRGKWVSPPGGSTPLHLAVKYLEGGLAEEGQVYIESLIEKRDTHPEYLTGSMLNLYGATMLDKKQYRKAEFAFRESLRLDATDRQAHIELGTILLRSKRGAQAVQHFETVLKQNATDPELFYKLGMAHLDGGSFQDAKKSFEKSVELRSNPSALWQLANLELQLASQKVSGTGSSNQNSSELGSSKEDYVKQAVEHYERAIQLTPDLVYQANNLAWLLATSANDDLRNGKRALDISQKICSQSNKVTPSSVDTLAASFAEAGDFKNAVQAAKRAIEAANRAGNAGLASRIEARMELYKRGKPFRDAL